MTKALTLAQADRVRLAKLLSMLGSDHAGERDNAGLAASRLIRQREITWEQVLDPPPVERRLPEYGTWRTTCTKLMARPRALRPWERTFVADLPKFPRISVKQRYFLNEIAQRVLGEDR
jgi:hypothetical protein